MDQALPFEVVFLAGGIGSRMKAAVPKQYLAIQDKPLALYSFEVFVSMPEVQHIVVVCEPAYQELFLPYAKQIRLSFAYPGPRRQDSLFNGIQLLEKEESLVCIHDSARPFINTNCVRRVVKEAEQCGAAALGVKAKATIKICDKDQMIVDTPDRAHVWEMQTPQVVRLELLKEGFTLVERDNLTVTDDVSLVELIGKPAKVVEGSYYNIKVTTPEDLFVAQQLLEKSHALL